MRIVAKSLAIVPPAGYVLATLTLGALAARGWEVDALATTGISGPGGGSEEKPVGLVYLALAAELRCLPTLEGLAVEEDNRRVLFHLVFR